MVQVLEQYNPFGKFGEGIGQGISEQLPKEIQRHSLKRGLESLKGQKLDPVDLAAKVSTLQGMTPETFNMIMPYLIDAGRRSGSSQNPPPDPSMNESSMSAMASKASNPRQMQGSNARQFQGENNGSVLSQPSAASYPQMQEDTGSAGIKGNELTQAQLDPGIRKGPDVLYQEARELSKTQFPNFQEALDFVNKREDTRLENIQNQRNTANAAQGLRDKIGTDLTQRWIDTGIISQVEGKMISSVAGTMLDRFKRDAENEVANNRSGLSEAQILDKYVKKAENVARSTDSMISKGKLWIFDPDRSREKVNGAIEATRKLYEENNGLKEFSSEVATAFDLSPQVAASLAFPVKNNENIYDMISKTPKTRPNLSELSLKEIATGGVRKSGIASEKRLFDKIIPLVNEAENSKDSYLSIANELASKGYSAETFMQEVKQRMNAGEINPNDRQREEIGKGATSLPSLGDIIFSRS